jgi:hypothetical protein
MLVRMEPAGLLQVSLGANAQIRTYDNGYLEETYNAVNSCINSNPLNTDKERYNRIHNKFAFDRN